MHNYASKKVFFLNTAIFIKFNKTSDFLYRGKKVPDPISATDFCGFYERRFFNAMGNFIFLLKRQNFPKKSVNRSVQNF